MANLSCKILKEIVERIVSVLAAEKNYSFWLYAYGKPEKTVILTLWW